jgi:hypothetical protein
MDRYSGVARPGSWRCSPTSIDIYAVIVLAVKLIEGQSMDGWGYGSVHASIYEFNKYRT